MRLSADFSAEIFAGQDGVELYIQSPEMKKMCKLGYSTQQVTI